MNTFPVTINQPNCANLLDSNSFPVPGPISQAIPAGSSSSVTIVNKGTVSIDYGLDVTPATALAAGASVVVALTTQKNLNLQGLNLLVDCIFTSPN